MRILLSDLVTLHCIVYLFVLTFFMLKESNSKSRREENIWNIYIYEIRKNTHKNIPLKLQHVLLHNTAINMRDTCISELPANTSTKC